MLAQLGFRQRLGIQFHWDNVKRGAGASRTVGGSSSGSSTDDVAIEDGGLGSSGSSSASEAASRNGAASSSSSSAGSSRYGNVEDFLGDLKQARRKSIRQVTHKAPHTQRPERAE